MSSILELSIKGVRSFSHEEEQTLKFLQPLTVITGHNGAGKTTIIECLRYACSGFFPPGAQNSCFVYDLKKAGSSQVEGFVDLRFKNKAAKQIEVRRNFKAFKKRGTIKIEFQSLPPTIKMLSNDGRVTESRSQRVRDLNEEMVEWLGISQTIMVNVIFCHQDESTWPLSDGKHLKEKFDEIFGATRYIKALESIKKLQKMQGEEASWNPQGHYAMLIEDEQDSPTLLGQVFRGYSRQRDSISLLQKDKENFEKWKDEAKQETERLESKQTELEIAETIVAHSLHYLEPKQKMLQEIKDRESHFQELEATIIKLNAKKDVMETHFKQLQEYCDKENEENLAAVIRKRKKIKAKKDVELKQLQQVNNELKENEKRLEIEQGQLVQEQKALEDLKCKLEKCVETMAGTMPGTQSVIDWNEESSLKFSLEDFQQRFQDEKRQLETQLDNVREEMSNLTHHETADVEFLAKEKQKLEKAKADIMCKHSQEVVQLIENHPENDWFRRLDDFHRSSKERIEQTRESLFSKKMERYRVECSRTQILEKKKDKEKKLQNLMKELKITESGDQSDIVTHLKFQEQERSWQDIFERGTSTPTTSLSSTDLKCPLCNRKFVGNETEKQTFLQIMKENLPLKLKNPSMGEQQLTQEWTNIFKMHRKTFLEEKIRKLSEKVIRHQKNLEGLESDIREEEEALSQLQKEEELASKLIPEISVFDYLEKQVSKCENEIETFKIRRKSADVQQKLEHDQEHIKSKINTITNGLITLENYVKDLERYTSLRENLSTNRSQLQEIQEKVAEKEKEMNDLISIINKFENSISKHKEKLKMLREYKCQLKTKQSAIEEVQQQLYTAMADERKARDSLVTTETKENLIKEISDLWTRKSEAEGRLDVLREDVKTLEEKLNQDRFCNVVDKHRECIVDLKTTEIANRDLKKYYDALDWAIIEFHKVKMKEINRIANEYWTKIYKGNDVDYIEIRSETSSSETSARRSYNYRVVMVCDGVEMDMRGRCSAGQKVLASLIIRLALAETFCLSCGILALDEPTTNLDYENKKGLASALTEIIEDKRKYKNSNFQLIIITHDEAFVEMLESSGYADHFYRIIKDDCGNSIIKQKNISDLQS